MSKNRWNLMEWLRSKLVCGRCAPDCSGLLLHVRNVGRRLIGRSPIEVFDPQAKRDNRPIDAFESDSTVRIINARFYNIDEILTICEQQPMLATSWKLERKPSWSSNDSHSSSSSTCYFPLCRSSETSSTDDAGEIVPITVQPSYQTKPRKGAVFNL